MARSALTAPLTPLMWSWQCAEPRNRKGIVDQLRITKHSTWRYFGLLANHHRQAQQAICRRLLGIAPAAPTAAPVASVSPASPRPRARPAASAARSPWRRSFVKLPAASRGCLVTAAVAGPTLPSRPPRQRIGEVAADRAGTPRCAGLSRQPEPSKPVATDRSSWNAPRTLPRSHPVGLPPKSSRIPRPIQCP